MVINISRHETDILSLTRKFKGKYTKEWYLVRDNWLSTFKNIQFNVNVDSEIINTGAITSIIKES